MKRKSYILVLSISSLPLVAFLYESTFLLTALLSLISLVIIYLGSPKSDSLLYVTSGVGGAGAEAIAINFGAWQYAEPNLLGVPIWLPVLWGIAAIYIKTKAMMISNHLS